ncbi:MAG TPA: hypothetical protein VGX92_05670 [Pyrinomonadaceae bacterium]|jgi:cytochrome c biogenesis protein CcdA|nr:hypothetical protein [Pyrinomonadaceae bacterium]
MYCSSCGTESTPGLNYCNRCGAGLNTQSLAASQKAPYDNLTNLMLILGAATTVISLGGMGLLIAGAIRLAREGFSTDPVMMMIFMGMTTILVVDILLVRQLSRLISAALPADNRTRSARETIAPPKQTNRQLNAHPEPAASVTENTTRTFEPAYRDSNR